MSAGPDEPPELADLIDELETLANSVDSEPIRDRIEESIDVARAVRQPTVFGRVIRGFDRADAAEAFVGSVVFGLPMLIEEGGRLHCRPPGLLRRHPPLRCGPGLRPALRRPPPASRGREAPVRRRAPSVAAVIAISLVPMAAWGRVDWTEPTVAFVQVSFVFVGMALGATLGDLLPGS